MAPKRQRRHAESPEADQASERGAVPPLEPRPPSSFNDASENQEFLHHRASTNSVTKRPSEGNGNGSLHIHHPVVSAEAPVPALGQTSDNQASDYAALPGITRKITACAACRKNKVCLRSRFYDSVELGLTFITMLRSDVICPERDRRARVAGGGHSRAY